MRLTIANGMVLSEDVLERGRNLVVEGGQVVGLQETSASSRADTVIDAAGGYVLPGLVDIHTHGLADAMVDKDDIHRYSLLQVENGATTCLPTLAGSPITDSLKGSGNAPGRYEGLIPGEPVEVTTDRGIRRISDGILSGSALTQIESFRNAVRKFGRTIAEASHLCSRTPARLLGLARKGTISPGNDADLIVLDADLGIHTVILGGRVVKG
jgi:N-acetylglucosamine-6-phosphate deacetylase